MRKTGNKYMNASQGVSLGCKGLRATYRPQRQELAAAHGLIRRTLAKYSEVLGRTPCRSSSPRRHL